MSERSTAADATRRRRAGFEKPKLSKRTARTFDGPAATKPIDYALWYAAHGWPVIPLHYPVDERCSCGSDGCRSVGKHPMTKHGVKDASADRTQIEKWWRKSPEANVGIATGRASNLIVLDVDPRHHGARSLKELAAACGDQLKTPTVRTGGGGVHLYFAYPTSLTKVNSRPLPEWDGIDVKADGGYVVAPPSAHASGERYRVASGTLAQAFRVRELPAKLLEMLGDSSVAKPERGAPSRRRNLGAETVSSRSDLSVVSHSDGNGVTTILERVHGVLATPGAKIACPRCGHKTLSIKRDNSVAKCFHPGCDFLLTGSHEPQSVTRLVGQDLRSLQRVLHEELVRRGERDSEAYRYLTDERRVRKEVIEATTALGVVPSRDALQALMKPLRARIDSTLDDLVEGSDVGEASRGGRPDSGQGRAGALSPTREATGLKQKVKELRRLLIDNSGWICFVHTDEYGDVCSVVLRKPYSKEFVSWTLGARRGVFMVNVNPQHRHEAPGRYESNLLVTEGHFNALQLQSIML